MPNNTSNKIILQDAIKKFTLDQDKILSPEKTIAMVKESLAKLNMDILEKTERIDNGRLDIPVYFSYCGKDAVAMTGAKKQMGKGATPVQAEASAIMELAERFSFFSFVNNSKNFFTDKYCNLKGKALPFEMIARSVHDDSIEIERSKKIFENLPLKWTPAYNLTKKKETFIPFNWFFTINEFNGPSAGNCIEEAVSQGICEIMERHVSSIISQNKLNVPLVDPDSATDPMVVKMLDKYKRAGIKIFISDFSLDTGIPSVGVFAYDPSTFPEKSEIIWTAGTTPDPQKALSRALTETAQLAGDFNTGSNYMASGLPKFNNIEDAKFIVEPGKTIDINQLPNLSDINIKVEIERLVSALSKKNMDVILINTTHDFLKIPAFYTIIPGAHFRERSLGTSVGMFSSKIIFENNTPSDALYELMNIEKILPDKYYIKFYTGSSHLAMGDPETALTYFKQALELEPNRQDIPSIYSYMGACLKDMGKYSQALEVLIQGETYDNERTDIYNLMGFCYFKLKNYESAIESFKKNIRLDPGSAIDYANIASNYRDMGDKEKAVQYYKIALQINPEIEFAKNNLEKLTQQTG